MRINKYLAHEGIASRREADLLVEAGRVKINGKKAQNGDQVNETDKVEVSGATKPKSYLAYYKGRGIITHSPTEREVDIATKLAKDYGITHVSPVGRLDKDSEGLMILSNDGRITGPLLDPEADHEKEYEVTVDKPISPMFIKAMSNGVDIEGYRTKKAKATKHKSNDKKFTIILTEGKKHQIRRMCAALGYQIQSLKRVRIMNMRLDKLKPNQYRKIVGPELQAFLKELGVEK